MMMNRVTPQKPVMNWREREALKEKQRKEEIARRAEEERLRGVRMTETNFPALGGAGVAVPKPITQAGFAQMAKEWKEQDDVEAYREQKRREDEARAAHEFNMPRSMFRMSRFSPQPEDMMSEPYEETPKPQDEWTTVDTRKTRPPRDLSIEEMEERDRRREEEENQAEDYEQNPEVADAYRRNFY